jgi:hypothetical protein
MFRAGNDGTNGNVFVTLALHGSSIRLRQVEPADTGTSSQFFFGNANRGDFDAVVDSTVIFTDANSIMATIAKQENIRRPERIRAGRARTKASGTKLGRPRVSDGKASRVTLWRRKRENS